MSSDKNSRCFLDVACDLINNLKQTIQGIQDSNANCSQNTTTTPKLPLPKDINKKSDGCNESFKFCHVVTDPDDPKYVAIVKETVSQEKCTTKDSANKDDVVTHYKYCKEVIKPFEKSFAQKCQSQEEILEYLRKIEPDMNNKDEHKNCKPAGSKNNLSPQNCKKKVLCEPPKTPCLFTRPSKSDVIAFKECEHAPKSFFLSDESNVCRKCPPPPPDYLPPPITSKSKSACQAHNEVLCTLRCAALDLAGKMAKTTKGVVEAFHGTSTEQLQKIIKKSESCLSPDSGKKSYEYQKPTKDCSNRVHNDKSRTDLSADSYTESIQTAVRKIASALPSVNGESMVFQKISDTITGNKSSKYDQPESPPAPKDINFNVPLQNAESIFDAIKSRIYSIFFNKDSDSDDTDSLSEESLPHLDFNDEHCEEEQT